MRSRCPNYKISISPNNFSSRILAYKHNENVANTALVRLYSIFEAIIIKYFFLLNFIQSLNLVLRNNFDLWTVIVVAFAQMSSLFIRYRTIVSGQEKKKTWCISPYILSFIGFFEFWLQFSPLPFCDIAPQYLFLWPRSNRFGCAPFRYFILFYFFFDSRIIAGSSCMDGLEIEKEQLCAWHTAVTCAQWTHRGQASTAVLISYLWIFLYHLMHAR